LFVPSRHDHDQDNRADNLDLAVFREWLKGCLESFPERNIPANVDLVVDGYDVVEAGDYPPEDKLAGPDGYDVIMSTGSSMSYLLPSTGLMGRTYRI
jgi:hypothetical protein